MSTATAKKATIANFDETVQTLSIVSAGTTFTYYKTGKLYFGFHTQQLTPQPYYVTADCLTFGQTAMAKLASDLGVTVNTEFSSFTTGQSFSNTYQNGIYYNGSTWVTSTVSNPAFVYGFLAN